MNQDISQYELISRLQRCCLIDPRIFAAMLYGSFANGTGDQYSDIDCILYFRDDALENIDQHAWVNQIAPVLVYYVNEFGNGSAIFDNFVRAEFHFDPASRMSELEKFAGTIWFPRKESTILVDKTGRLSKYIEALIGSPPARHSLQDVEYLYHSFSNWILFGANVFARGEIARAYEILKLVQDNLLRMARLQLGKTQHWITPTRRLESELSELAYHRYQACTSKLSEDDLLNAYLAAWEWGMEMLDQLFNQFNVNSYQDVMARLDQHIRKLFYENE